MFSGGDVYYGPVVDGKPHGVGTLVRHKRRGGGSRRGRWDGGVHMGWESASATEEATRAFVDLFSDHDAPSALAAMVARRLPDLPSAVDRRDPEVKVRGSAELRPVGGQVTRRCPRPAACAADIQSIVSQLQATQGAVVGKDTRVEAEKELADLFAPFSAVEGRLRRLRERYARVHARLEEATAPIGEATAAFARAEAAAAEQEAVVQKYWDKWGVRVCEEGLVAPLLTLPPLGLGPAGGGGPNARGCGLSLLRACSGVALTGGAFGSAGSAVPDHGRRRAAAGE